MNAASTVVAAKNKSFIVSCMSSTLRLILSTYALLFCFVKTARLLVQQNLGIKKNTCGSGSRPTLFFSADPIIFST